MLQNSYLLMSVEKIGFDTAENEPCQVCPTEPASPLYLYGGNPPQLCKRHHCVEGVLPLGLHGLDVRHPGVPADDRLVQAHYLRCFLEDLVRFTARRGENCFWSYRHTNTYTLLVMQHMFLKLSRKSTY